MIFLLQEAPQAPAQPPQSAPTMPIMIGYIAVVMAIIYFIVLRPQKKRDQQRKQQIANLKKNDRVLTTSGIYGTFVSRTDREIVLKLDENVRVRFSPNAIAEVLAEDGVAGAEKPG
jgi:preprotein translocase subunit YajC